MAPTRALGDYKLKFPLGDNSLTGSSDESYISHKPDIKVYSLKPEDKFLILGTDGLWDQLKLPEVAHIFDRNINDPRKIHEKYNFY